MKTLFTLLAALLLSLSAAAQSAQGFLNFSYQAVVRNSSGTLVSNQAIGMRVSLLQGSATGAPVYVETHAPTTNANGLATLAIGGGTRVSGNFFTILWSSPGGYFLKTEIDPLGGTNYTITGTTQLLSVPYAMYAQVAGASQDLQIGQLFGGGIIFSLWRDNLGVQHGLVASLDNLGNRTFANPALMSSTAGASADNGAVNTSAIVAALGTNAANTAAGVCDAYVSGSFTDWYLPASMELAALYAQAAAINSVLNNDNNPLTNGLGISEITSLYWSSTLLPDNGIGYVGAVFQAFTIGGQSRIQQNLGSGQQLCVRAIRRF